MYSYVPIFILAKVIISTWLITKLQNIVVAAFFLDMHLEHAEF